jgi:hypothetical protein
MSLANVLFDKKLYDKDQCMKYLNRYGYKPIDVDETDMFYSYKISSINTIFNYRVVGGYGGVFFNVGFSVQK